MSVFRARKVKNFTVMSNTHLLQKDLSFKARGILSTILALPDDWEYSVEGLAKMAKDGVKSTRSGIKELEENGYLVRRQERDEKGSFTKIIYDVYEIPLDMNASSCDETADNSDNSENSNNQGISVSQDMAETNSKDSKDTIKLFDDNFFKSIKAYPETKPINEDIVPKSKECFADNISRINGIISSDMLKGQNGISASLYCNNQSDKATSLYCENQNGTTAGFNADNQNGISAQIADLTAKVNVLYNELSKISSITALLPQTLFGRTDNPPTEKCRQQNTIKQNTIKQNTMKQNTIKQNTVMGNMYDTSIYQSIPNTARIDGIDRIGNTYTYTQSFSVGKNLPTSSDYEHYKKIIKDNITYSDFEMTRRKDELERIDEIVDIMTDMVVINTNPVRINGNFVSAEIVRNQFLKIDYDDIEYILTALANNSEKIGNIRSYLITTIYNARFTKCNYYKAEVNYDFSS